MGLNENPQLTVLSSPADGWFLLRYLQDKEYVAFDIETTGLSKKDDTIGFSICAEESVAYYMILGRYQQDDSIQFSYHRTSEILKLLMLKKLICHNGVFDCSMIENNFGVRLIEALHTDTMVLAHVLNENRKIGLKELARSMYGESSTIEQTEMKASIIANGGSVTKANYELYKADPYLIGKYGAKDAWLTYKLFIDLVPKLFEQKLDKFFYEEESMPLLRGPTYQLNTSGLQVDVNKLASLKKDLETECNATKEFIDSEVKLLVEDTYPGTTKKNTFNIESSAQLAWLLFSRCGLEFDQLTKEGRNLCRAMGLSIPRGSGSRQKFIKVCRDSVGTVYENESVVNGKVKRAKKVREPWHYIMCDKKTLAKFATALPWVKKLLEYKASMKLLGTYVTGIEKRMNYGVIQPSFLQHVTPTGRYVCRNPNFQNLTSGDQRVKECIVPRPGKVFVINDFSQIEPRLFSFHSQDPKLMAAFEGTKDFHSVVGVDVYEKYDSTPEKSGSPYAFGVKYPELRDLAKKFDLATAYGATPSRLAAITGKSVAAIKQDVDRYFKKFPGVQDMMLEAHRTVMREGEIKSLFGRPRRLPEAIDIGNTYGNVSHWDLPYDARNVLNQAVNFINQSAAASIINRAAIKFYADCRELQVDCQIVSQVHDELVVECREEDAERVSSLLQNAMEKTTILEGMPLEAIPRISKSLAKPKEK